MSLAVIVPNHNKAQFIEECVKSILRQTLLPDEIWIIDDCSTDNSKEIIIELAKVEKRIKPVFLEKNVGVSAARNIGLKSANTEYVTTLDSDDFLISNKKLENEINAIKMEEASGNLNCFAYSQTVPVDINGQVLNWHIRNNLDGYLQGSIKEKLLAYYIPPYAMPRDYCIRRSIILDFGLFDENSSYFEDFDLLLRVSSTCKAIFTRSEGVAYRQNPNGLAQTQREKFKMTIKCIRIKYFKKFSFFSKIKYLYFLSLNYIRRFINKIKSYL